MNSAILFVGPHSPRNTGQSVVFSAAFKSYIGRKHLVNTTQYNLKILNILLLMGVVLMVVENQLKNIRIILIIGLVNRIEVLTMR